MGSSSRRLLNQSTQRRVAISTADTVTVPEGYTVQVIAPWGDPVGMSGARLAGTAARRLAETGARSALVSL